MREGFVSFFYSSSPPMVGFQPPAVALFGPRPKWVSNCAVIGVLLQLLLLLLAWTPSCLGCDFENRIQCRWKSNRHGPLSDGTFIDAWQVKKPEPNSFYAYNRIKRDFKPGHREGRFMFVSSLGVFLVTTSNTFVSFKRTYSLNTCS